MDVVKVLYAIVEFLVNIDFLEVRELRNLHKTVCKDSNLKVLDFDKPKLSGKIVKKRIRKVKEKKKSLPLDEEKSCDALGITLKHLDFIEMGQSFIEKKLRYYEEELYRKVKSSLDVLYYILVDLNISEIENYVSEYIRFPFKKKLNSRIDSESIYTGVDAFRELRLISRIFLVIPKEEAEGFKCLLGILANSSSDYVDSPNYLQKLAQEFGFKEGQVVTCQELEGIYSEEKNLLDDLFLKRREGINDKRDFET